MLKTVDTARLAVGMFIHDLNCGWMVHPFARNRFLIRHGDEIREIVGAGIREVVIDSDKGLDVLDALTLEQVRASAEVELMAIAAQPVAPTRVALGEELARAAQIRQQAWKLMKTVMGDARLGKVIDVAQVQPVVQSITESILRNPGALVGMMRIQNKDDYTLLHSVSVCTLLVAFCGARGLDADTTYQAGLGGLLHDTGKALVPDHILNKPGPLTPEEFAVIKKHPQDGYDILVKSGGVGAVALDITLHHHERRDASGYPHQLGGDAIGELAQMAAIVDVYDAITADRCYHKGISAAEAMRKIHQWSKFHFNPHYVQQFMRCIGIYPVGTMVMLESGRLAVVVEPHPTNLLAPKVNVFFHTRSNAYIRPETVDLSRAVGFGGADRILRPESPRKWNVDPARFLQIA